MTTSATLRELNPIPAKQLRPLRAARTPLGGLGLCLGLPFLLLPAIAADRYWDINGATAGAGGTTPAGIWDTATSNWSSDTGGITPALWSNGDTAIFSAGADAIGLFTVNLVGAQTAAGVTVQEGTVTLDGSGLTLSAPTISITNKATINAIVSGSSGLIKAGAGELVLAGANDFTGGLSFNAGTLTLNNDSAASTGGITFNSAATLTLKTTENVTVANAVNLGGAGSTHDIVAESGKTLTLNGVISNSRNWRANGVGTVVLGGVSPNTFAGTLTVAQGTLVAAKDQALGSTLNGTIVSSGATLGFQGGYQYTVNELVTINGTGAGSVGAICNFSGHNEFWGTVALASASSIGAAPSTRLDFIGPVSGGLPLTKTGTGQINLFGSANNYTTTTVSQGVLGVWFPANAGTNLATVNAGATLVGNGDVPGGIDLSGNLLVGDFYPDQLDSGSQTWRNGAKLGIKINDASGTAGSDPGWDWLNITGGLDFNPHTAGNFTLELSSLDALYNLGDIANFNNTQEYNWTIVSTTTGISGFATNKFILNTNDFSNDQGGGRFVILTANSGNDLVLRFDPPPVITCPANITKNNDSGSCGASVTFAASATDNQPGVAITYATNGLPIVSGAFFPVGTTTVDATATDSVGNTDSCSFTVTVTDSQFPVVVTKNITIQLNASGNASIVAGDVNNGSSDNCGIASMSVSPNAFTCANVGVNTVTLTVTDIHGNFASAPATVTVQDVTPPTVVAQNITVQLNASGNASITAGQVNNGSTDACGIQSMSVSPNAFTCANIGANTVTLTVTDVNGNSANTTATVTVQDSVAPTVLTQNLTIQLDATGNASITAAQLNNGSTDACGIQSMSVSPNAFTCANIGANTVTLTVTDVNGNSTSNTATVTVEDKVAPALVVNPISVNLNAAGEYTLTTTDIDDITVGSSDACGIATKTVTPSSFTFCHVATSPNAVQVIITDVNGNATTNNTTVTVVAPSAPAVVYVDDNYGTSYGAVTWPNGSGTTNYYIGYNAFNTIQAAVASVGFGGSIQVANGSYAVNSTLYIQKSLTLAGESEAGVTIDLTACGASWGIAVNTNNCTLSNFTILPPISLPNNGGYAIHAAPAESLTPTSPKILNLTLAHITAADGHRTSFDLQGVDGGLLDGLTATGFIRGNGISLTACDNIVVRNCSTSGNAWGGLAVYTSSYLQDGSSNISIEATCSFAETRAIYLEPGAYSISGITYVGNPLANAFYTVDFSGGNLTYTKTEADALAIAAAALYAGYPSTITAPDTTPIPLDTDKDLVQVDDNWIGYPNGTPVLVAGTNFTIGFNAFATIQGGVAAVNANGTVNTLVGNYVELVTIGKSLTLQSDIALGAHLQAPVAATSAALISVDASGVTLKGFDLLVNQPDATAGIYMNSTGADPDTNLIVKDCRFKISGLATAHAADSYIGFDTASTAIAVDGNGGFPSVQLLNNQILPDSITAPTAMFDRAIFLREANGTIAGNTVYGDAHDLAAQFVSYGALTVSNNLFLGKGGRDTKGAQVDFTEPNSNGSVLCISNTITPFAPATPSGSQHVRSVMIKNNYSGASVVIEGNAFTEVQEVAILAGNSKNTVIKNNTFTPKFGDTSFVHVQIGNKVATGGAPLPVHMNALVLGNTFNDSGVAGGRAIEFLNHNATGATFGTITIGGAGALANTFAANLDRFIHLDSETQANSTASARPYYSIYGATVMAPFAVSLDATGNLFDMGAGPEDPASMTLAKLHALENKLHHAPDVAGLGLIRVKAANVYVTTASGSVQRGIDAATAGDTVNLGPGTFTENVALSKRVALIGQGSGPTDSVLASVAGGDSKTGVIQLTASGLSVSEPVLIKDVRISAVGRAGISVGRFTESTGTSVEYVKLDNVKVIGSNLSPCTEQERGLYVDLTSSLQHLDVNSCAFDNLHYGWYIQKITSADVSTVRYVQVTDTSFSHNNTKGLYAEKLSDATFLRCTIQDNGYDASLLSACTYFQPWMSGFDINLKAGTYENLAFNQCDFLNNALGGAKEGVGLAVKARDDGATYGAFPASANNVLVTNCRIEGNERGVRFGEPGKNNAGPTSVVVENCSIVGNIQTYTGTDGSQYGGLINMCQASIDASSNWWGDLSGPSGSQNPYGTGNAVVGANITISPWLREGDQNGGNIGFQPAAGLNSIPTQLAFAVSPGSGSLGATLVPNPKVEVRDASGNLTPWANPTITVALQNNPGSGILTGTLGVLASSGASAFGDLGVIGGGGSGLTLNATAPHLTGATSAAFDIDNPLPILTSLNPAGAVTAPGTVSVAVSGSGFVPSSVVNVNGSPVTTSFNSASQLTATLDTTTAGTYSVTVVTPAAGGGTSVTSLPFVVDSQPAIVWVDDNFGPGNAGSHSWGYDAFATIADGINAVTNGGTVNVAAGTYAPVNINKSVTLLGANAGSPCAGNVGASVIAGGTGTAVAISAVNVTVDGFALSGAVGVSNSVYTGAVVQNNKIDVAAQGIAMQNIAGTFTIQDNCITLSNQLAGANPSVGIVVAGTTGGATVIENNSISDAFYGCLLYGVNNSPAVTVKGGTITGVMQGVAVINSGPAPFSTPLPSVFAVEGVTMSGFTGDYSSLYPATEPINFHAGVYVFTGVASTSAHLIAGTITNVTVTGTGNPSQASAGLYFADFSTDAGLRQNIQVKNSTLTGNQNRGVDVAGKNANVTIMGCTLTENGGNPFVMGDNDGFGISVRNGAQVTVSETAITNPATQVGGTVTALATFLSGSASDLPSLTISGSSILQNGNGALARQSSGSLNASGNWWGGISDIAIADLMLGDVDFNPYLGSGTDTDGGTAGFQSDFGTLHVTTRGSQTGGLIAEGIASVSSGGTVSVEAGAYPESLTINKALTLQSSSGPSATIVTGNTTAAVTIAMDNVTVQGLTIRNPGGKHGISAADRSHLVIANNRVVEIGTSDATTTGSNMGISVASYGTANVDDVIIIGNVVSNLVGNASGNKTAQAIVVGFSGGTGNITGLVVASNRVTDVYSTLRGAYGIILNHTTSPAGGQTVAPLIYNNEVVGLEGLWAHAIGLEGNTPNAVVCGNVINNIVDHKSPAEPDAVGVMVEDNAFVSSVTITNNSFAGVLIGVRNVTGLPVSATGNWWSNITGPTTTANVGGAGVAVSANVDFSPWLADGTDTDLLAIGFQPNATALNYTPAGLVFSTQPVGNVGLGMTLLTQPVVTVTNEVGGTATQFTGAVALTIHSPNPHGGVLAGTLSVNAAGGVATFTGLNMTVSGGAGYQLDASSLPPIIGATSAAFSINNPAPTLDTIDPTFTTAGGAVFTLTVNGSDFFDTSVVHWNGSARTTTFVSHGQLTAEIPDTDIATAGSADVTVFTPTPGGGTSSPITFWITPSGSPTDTFVDDDYTGLPTGTIVSWPRTGGTGTHYIGYDAFATIQGGVNAAASTYTVHVAAGTYNEDVNLNKTVSVLGAGDNSIIVGPIGGISQVVKFSAPNIVLDGFKITRAGNNLTDWNNPNLNDAGVHIQGLSSGTVRNCLITGNRTGVDINNSSGITVRNNVITDNRTGVIMRNKTDNLVIVENKITDNWTVGVLFLDASSGSNSPLQQAANCTFSNNDISGNWYGQIVDRQTGGSLPAPTSNLKNFSGNWLGTTTPVISTANSAEPGYAVLIPVTYGGTATAPGGQPEICGTASANIDYTPMLAIGTDTDVSTGSGTYGFQGDFSTLHVSAASAQVGSTGRIQEGIDLVTASTVYVHSGTYTEGPQILINKDVSIIGDGLATTIIKPGGDTGSSGDARGWWLVNSCYDFNLSGVTLDGTGRLVWQAIRHKGHGTLTNVRFTQIQYQASGPAYNGTAVAAFGGCGAVDISGCEFDNIGRVGVLYYGVGTTGTASDNTYTGKGAGNWLDYAYDISAGAQVVVSDNVITGNLGVASSDGSTSAGLLVSTYFGGGTTAKVLDCAITGNTSGLVIGYDGSDVSKVMLQGNDLTGNTDAGIQIVGAAIVDMGQLPPGSNNTGLGISTGGNDLSGYSFDKTLPWAIDASGSVSPGQILAYNNDFGAAPADDINSLITDGFDGSGPLLIEFSQAGDLTAVAPTNVTVECAGSIPAAATTLAGYIAQGGVVSESPVSISSVDAPPTYPAGDFVLTRTYTLNGAAGRSVTVSQTITVDDVTAPSITAPVAVLATNDLNQCYATGVALGTPSTSDNCGIASAGNNAPAQFPVGNTLVTWTVTDHSGLTATANQTVTVVDLQPPAAIAGTIASCYTTQSAAEADAVAATSATDNCGVDTIAVQSTVGTCSAVITVRVTDIHGNYTDVTYNTRVDGTAPTLGAIAAAQGANNVKDGANTVLQGVVNLSVVAGDNCGLVNGHPSVTLVNGAITESATFASGAGTVGDPFHYTWTVTASTAGGTWTATVSATDLCESTNAIFTLDVNKNEISGLVALENFVGTNRTVVFKATGSTSSNATVLKTWTVPLTFTNGVADYKLTAVPDDTLGLSAKTDWNLRRKLGVALADGQGTVNFTGTSQVLGGDVLHANLTSFNKVLSDDYLAIVNHWLSTTTPASDITGDGAVNIIDYSIIAQNWQQLGDPE